MTEIIMMQTAYYVAGLYNSNPKHYAGYKSFIDKFNNGERKEVNGIMYVIIKN